MTTQQKILAALKEIANEHDLQWIEDRSWANTGTVRLQRVDAYETLLQFHYSFQTGYFSIRFTDADNDPHNDFPYISSSNGEEITEMMESAGDLMLAATTKK